ncbi:class I SAM-dependent methyltransferase [Streptomyces sp. NPDC006872]|uniref:class I SAM-dependent methyltransferase n=1 Tax=Streptomyces sp. NPDC006872 TaxID=3155720 RepID=UPI0033C85791
MGAADIIEAWDRADPSAIHPTRGIDEDAYWGSGRDQAADLATVLPAGCKVVDFGCGDGRVAIPLRTLGYDVTAVDASPTMLDRLHQHDPDMPTVLSPGAGLYAALGKKADAVVSLAVLIHHNYADCLDLLTELRQAVKLGGTLILDWPISDEPVEGQVWLDVTTWSQEAHDDACTSIGLKPVDSGLPWGVYKAVKAN